MSRRRQATRRPVNKDGKFQSTLVARLVNTIMQGGKKSTARTHRLWRVRQHLGKKSGEQPD